MGGDCGGVRAERGAGWECEGPATGAGVGTAGKDREELGRERGKVFEPATKEAARFLAKGSGASVATRSNDLCRLEGDASASTVMKEGSVPNGEQGEKYNVLSKLRVLFFVDFVLTGRGWDFFVGVEGTVGGSGSSSSMETGERGAGSGSRVSGSSIEGLEARR